MTDSFFSSAGLPAPCDVQEPVLHGRHAWPQTRRTPIELDRSLALSGFALKRRIAAPVREAAVSCCNPVCPFGCQLGRHVRLDRRGPKSSASVGTEAPSVDRHPKEALRRSVEGWAPSSDQCPKPKREAGDSGFPNARPKPGLSPLADFHPPSSTEGTYRETRGQPKEVIDFRGVATVFALLTQTCHTV
jgi:hypothetical protein